MNDELCSLNFDLNLNKAYGKAPPSLSPQQKKPIESLVVNFLLGSYWTTLPELKKRLEFTLASTDYLEEIAPKVSVFDEKTQKVRIKDEFLKGAATADIYMFYKDPVKKQEILSGIISKSKKDNEIDIVSGSGKFNDLPQHLQEVQMSIFQSTLPEFLSQFLQHISSETEKSSSVIRPVLRLILLNFQVAHVKAKEEPNLLNRLEQNYSTSDFEENLKKILPSHQDCKMCIEKILALKLQLTASEKAEIPKKMITEDEKKEVNKNLAKERMKKIQEEFLKKQAKFAEKNIDTMEEEILTAATKTGKASFQCQHCLEYIQEGATDYGLPVYFNFTNNLHQNQWWPVLSSCNHYYHKNCFNKLFENNAANFQNPFYSKEETCCTLCKTLCNFFLQANPQGGDMDFFKNIKRVFENYRLKNPPFKDGFPEEEILKRAYDYYLKTANDESKHYLYVLFFENAILSMKKFSPLTSTSFFSQLMTNHQDAILTKLFEVLFPHKEDDLQKQYLMVIKDILAFKAVELFSQQFEKGTVADLCNFFKDSKSLGLLESSDLVKILRMVLRAFYFNQCLLVSHNSAAKFRKEKEEDVDALLLDKFGFKTNLQNLFQEVILEMEERPIDEKALIDSHTTLQPLIYTDEAPKMVTLPSTYAEFNGKYFRQKCVLCNGYSSHLNSCICLICGVVVCEKACDSGEKKSGNLNSHCKEHHLGIGYFLDKHHLRLVLINSPLNIRSDAKELYTDSLGQSILKVLDDSMTVSKIDFKKFTLNKRLAEEIKKVIMTCGIEKELFRILITGKEKRIRDGLL